MVTKHIVVLPYDAAWEQNFTAIKNEIQQALGELALRIEHVGSTSVKGLSAKPIIDMDVVIRNNSVLDTVIAALRIWACGNRSLCAGLVGRSGFLSPQKRRLFARIAGAATASTKIRFWADIDKGGFQMFRQLQGLIPALTPMRMSGEYVERFRQYGLMRSKEYLSALETDAKNGEYPCLVKPLKKFCGIGVTIEQEVFLNE